ncbi:hypothetical protein BDQ17DRAFT_1352443 [Cyathus striatus]|nr:hypothetical protein BDQ17DRAFT_1352443 [Cyathus striatus]
MAFNLSYIILTPRRVRLPTDIAPQSNPKKSTTARSSFRWSTAIVRSLKRKSSRPPAISPPSDGALLSTSSQ